MGKLYSEQEILILDQDGENLVIGVIWYNSVMTAKPSEITKIVDIRGFEIPVISEEAPIDFNQDSAPEDESLTTLSWMHFLWVRTMGNARLTPISPKTY